ncbi:MAG: transglycosylase SLT domain-containing protein [Anaerovoracaceae bacterium]
MLTFRKIIAALIIISMIGLTLLASVSSAFAETDAAAGSEKTAAPAENTQQETAKKKTKKKSKKQLRKERAKKRAARYRYGIAKYIHKRGVSWKDSKRIAKHFYTYAKKNKVSVAALMSIAQHESNFREKAYNPAGYYGLMQCSAQIGRSWAGVGTSKLLTAKYNIKAGSGLFRYNVKTLGSYYMGFAGYQAGTYGAKAGRYSRSAVASRVRVMNSIRSYLKKYRKA